MMRRPRDRSELDSVSAPQRAVFDLEFPANALCTNRDGTLLAAAGRKVFKILRIVPEGFEPMMNLRDLHQKLLNLNYSSNDVQWNPKDESQLASAPTNGSVVLWDLNKRSKSKLDYVYEESHQRAVNKLSYHPREPHTLLSGSQDYTMRIFDTRMKTVVALFKGPDSVRDVKFAALPTNDSQFAACYDNGMLQVWDRRHGDNPLKNLTLHSGPVYCCAWHEQENIIISAGRDKMIKVMDLQQARAKEVATVHALFSVARVRWRPGHRYHITSCSHFLDNMVAIWDFRRPYVPFASFSEHADDITDFLWLNDQVLFSCSKDGKIIQQLFSDADRLTERTTPVGLSFSAKGCLALACSDSLARKNKTTYSNSQSSRSSMQPMHFKKPEQDVYQYSFLLHTSQFSEFTKKTNKIPMQNFVKCATTYELHGRPTHELCDHNYKVASDLGKEDTAQTWLLLKLLYCGGDPECSRLGLLQSRPVARSSAGGRLSTSQIPSVTVDSANESRAPSRRDSIATDSKVPHVPTREPTLSADSAHEDEEEAEESNAADVSADLDFFELDEKNSDIGPPQISVQPQQQAEWGELPAEPFELRHAIVMRPPSPEHDTVSALTPSFAESSSSLRQYQQEGPVSTRVPVAKPLWDYSSVVTSVLRFYANKGDVQTSVSVLLVLGDKGKDLVDETTAEQWFKSYIDLLMRYQLWCEAALVIKLCPLPVVNEMNQQSTSYHTGCGHCGKLMENRGWQCRRCEKIASLCAVCHCTVRGVFMWCQLCGHGGHLQHLLEWRKISTKCPAGCGHNCAAARVQL